MYVDTKKRPAEKTASGGAKKQKVKERDPKPRSKQALVAAKAEVMQNCTSH